MTDLHVVAYLAVIVDLGAGTDHRVLQRAAVDAGVGADFHVVFQAHPADVVDLDRAGRTGGVTEAVRADDAARVHDYTVAEHYARVDGDVRIEPATSAERYPLADHAACPNGAVLAKHRASADDRVSSHAHAGAKRGAEVNACPLVHADGRQVRPYEVGAGVREREAGVWHARYGAVVIRDPGRGGWHHQQRRLAGRRSADHLGSAHDAQAPLGVGGRQRAGVYQPDEARAKRTGRSVLQVRPDGGEERGYRYATEVTHHCRLPVGGPHFRRRPHSVRSQARPR